MIRVLHLLHRNAPHQTRRGAAALAAGAGPEFQFTTRTLGRGGDHRNAAGAFLSLRREREAFEVVHAWDDRGMTAAALAGVGRIIYSPEQFLDRRAVRWLRSVMDHRDMQLVCATATHRRACVQRGIPLNRCHLIRPGVDFARVRRRRDLDLRRRLGFGDEDRVILAPGESTRAAAHEHAVWAMAVSHLLDPRYRLLLWGRGNRAELAALRAERLKLPQMVRIATTELGADVEPEALLPATDAVLVTAKGPIPTLSLATCMAAGLPIVSTVTYTVAELLEDRHTALLSQGHGAPAIAKRLMELYDDPGLQWSIADQARSEAYDYFAQTRFIDQYRAIYRQVAAGSEVEVPEPPPGAGRRFSGRGG